jgi:dihydropteroate synthase
MTLTLGSRTYDDHQRLVMAIINRTPDSFFDRGRTFADDDAFRAVDTALDAGADIIDIGGVKAGPGPPVDPADEAARTVEFIAAVRQRHPDAVLSIDTWRHDVAEAACDAGVDLLNDAWGGYDPDLARVAADRGVGLVCTHTGGSTPRTRPHRVTYDNVVDDVRRFFEAETDRVVGVGVQPQRLLVDPGHDFGKNTRHSLAVTAHLDRLCDLGWPLLVSLSNKDFIGESLDRPVDDRLVGTLAATAITAWLGARVFRVHQPEQTRQVLQLVAAVAGESPPAVARRGLA